MPYINSHDISTAQQLPLTDLISLAVFLISLLMAALVRHVWVTVLSSGSHSSSESSTAMRNVLQHVSDAFRRLVSQGCALLARAFGTSPGMENLPQHAGDVRPSVGLLEHLTTQGGVLLTQVIESFTASVND